MEVMKHYDDLTGKMIDVVSLEDAMQMADEVRMVLVEEIQEKMSKCISDMEIREIVAQYVE